MLLFKIFTLWGFFLKKKVAPKYSYLVYIFSYERVPDQFHQFFTNVKYIDSLDDISWFDLVFRRVHFYRVQRQSGARSRIFKRWIIKLLKLEIKNQFICLLWLRFLFDQEDKKNIFVFGVHIVDAFKLHFPSYKVNLVFGSPPKWVCQLLSILISLSLNRVINPSTKLSVFIGEGTLMFLRCYRRIFPNRKIILRFHDKIYFNKNESLSVELHQLLEEGIINQAESYSRYDAQRLGIMYRGNGVNADVIRKFKHSYREFLCIFIGTSEDDRNRLDAFLPIMSQLEQIYRGAKNAIKVQLIKGSEVRLSYEQYLKIMTSAEIQVDMIRLAQDEGYSLRIPASLFLDRKVITDRLNIVQEDFYDTSRFFIIGIDPISRLKSFLKEPLKPVPEAILKKYDVNNWWRNH